MNCEFKCSQQSRKLSQNAKNDHFRDHNFYVSGEAGIQATLETCVS